MASRGAARMPVQLEGGAAVHAGLQQPVGVRQMHFRVERARERVEPGRQTFDFSLEVAARERIEALMKSTP